MSRYPEPSDADRASGERETSDDDMSAVSQLEREAELLPPMVFYAELADFCEEMAAFYRSEFETTPRHGNNALLLHYTKLSMHWFQRAQRFRGLAEGQR